MAEKLWALGVILLAACATPSRANGAGGPPPGDAKPSAAAPALPAAPGSPDLGEHGPLGNAGRSPARSPDDAQLRQDLEDYGYDSKDFKPVPDRWRVPSPAWYRYSSYAAANEPAADSPYMIGSPLNPYRQNVRKGDYTVLGQNTFFQFQLLSDTLLEYRDLPTPSAISTARPGTQDFFGSGKQYFFQQNIALTFELFHGNTAFKPPDYLIRVTPVFNVTYLDVQENNAVNIDVREGTTRSDGHVALQEAFIEKHLVDLSPNYDFLSVIVGIQPFVTDFRGFVFIDNNMGARLVANWDNNRSQANLALFTLLEKNTNSELNSFEWRDQYVFVANYFRQDFIWFGYTAQLSFHWNHDEGDPQVDENGFPVRPAVIGTASQHTIDAVYLGWAGDGHIGRLNITHEYFFVFGEDDDNPIAGQPVDIMAQMFFVELSVDFDWYRLRGSFFWASGDDDPGDGDGTGFDGILDNPNFAGGAASYWIRQSLRLFGVGLNQRLSVYPDLRSNKIQGEANFVNPGLFFLTAGVDAELMQELRTSLNFSYLAFDTTATLEPFANQNDISSDIGFEITLLAQYRPLLTQNVQFFLGLSALFPGEGFEDIYETDSVQFSLFLQMVLIY